MSTPTNRGGRPKLPTKLKNWRHTIERRARRCGLDFHPVVFEMISSDEMGELAAYSGYPVRYHHWQFGQESLRIKQDEDWGMSKIYEMVIATNPTYAYLLESSPLVVQKMVMAHVFGHADFFKNNSYYQDIPTDLHDRFGDNAERIDRIRSEYGKEEVDQFLEVCLSLADLFDPLAPLITFRPKTKSSHEPREPKHILPPDHLPDYMDSVLNPPDAIEAKKKLIDQEVEAQSKIDRGIKIPASPIRDVLGFVLDHAPLKPWQQDIVHILREEEQCLWRGGQTKFMNEGWASYWHAHLMAEDGIAADNELVEFAHLHSGVFSGGGSFNPYRLGLQLWRDIKYRWDTGRHGAIWDEVEAIEIRDRWDEFIVFKTFFDKHGGLNEKTRKDWNEFCALIQETQAGRGLVKPPLFAPALYITEWINYQRAGTRLKELAVKNPDYWSEDERKDAIEENRFYLKLREKIHSGSIEVSEVSVPDSWVEWAKTHQFHGRLGDGLKKIFEVRSTYNDVNFIQEFFTADFCTQERYFTYGVDLVIDNGNFDSEYHYVIRSRLYERVKRLLLDRLINFGRPKIVIWDANYRNNGELRLVHLHDGRNLSRREIGEVLLRVFKLWSKHKMIYLDSLILRWPKRKGWWEDWEPGRKDDGPTAAEPKATWIRWVCDGNKVYISGLEAIEPEIYKAMPYKSGVKH